LNIVAEQTPECSSKHIKRSRSDLSRSCLQSRAYRVGQSSTIRRSSMPETASLRFRSLKVFSL